MSVAMIASFMPSLAFAAAEAHTHDYTAVKGVTASTEQVAWSAVKDALKTNDAKYVKVTKEPTCTEAGEVVITCKKDDCSDSYMDHTKTLKITEGHTDLTTTKTFSAEELAAQLVKQYNKNVNGSGWTQADADKFLKAAPKADNGESYCYYTVGSYCEACGKVVGTIPAYNDTAITTTTTVIKAVAHDRDTKTAGCVTKAPCLKCGKVVKISSTATPTAHTPSADKYVKISDATCTEPAKEAPVCEKCGEPVLKVGGTSKVRNIEGSKPLGHNISAAKVDASEATTNGTLKKGYFRVSTKDAWGNTSYEYYKANAVVGDKTLKKSADGCYEANMGVKCATCDAIINFEADHTVEMPANGVLPTLVNAANATADDYYPIAQGTHDYETEEVAATCTTDAKTVKTCKVCGFKTEVVKKDSKLGHNYKVVETKADCVNPHKVVITCTNKDCPDKATTVTIKKTGDYATYSGKFYEDASHNWFFKGFNGELAMSQYIAMPKFDVTEAYAHHDLGIKELIKEADCTHAALWGRKCKTCGKVDPSTLETQGVAKNHKLVKINVAPTCGDYGYYIEKCENTGKYVCDSKVDATGFTADITKATKNTILTEKPLTAPGAAHKFDKWVVTKEATVFEEGVKQLECSVCGAKDATKTIIAKKTVGAPEVKLVSKKGKLTVKASAADNATGYEVTYKRAGKKATTKTYTAESISKTYKLLKGKKYTVKVTAFASNGTDTVKGETVTKTITIKK